MSARVTRARRRTPPEPPGRPRHEHSYNNSKRRSFDNEEIKVVELDNKTFQRFCRDPLTYVMARDINAKIYADAYEYDSAHIFGLLFSMIWAEHQSLTNEGTGNVSGLLIPGHIIHVNMRFGEFVQSILIIVESLSRITLMFSVRNILGVNVRTYTHESLTEALSQAMSGKLYQLIGVILKFENPPEVTYQWCHCIGLVKFTLPIINSIHESIISRARQAYIEDPPVIKDIVHDNDLVTELHQAIFNECRRNFDRTLSKR